RPHPPTRPPKMASGQSPGDDLVGRGRSCQFLAADVDLPGGQPGPARLPPSGAGIGGWVGGGYRPSSALTVRPRPPNGSGDSRRRWSTMSSPSAHNGGPLQGRVRRAHRKGAAYAVLVCVSL